MNVTDAVRELASSGFQGTAADWNKAIPKSAYRSVWYALQILCAKHEMQRLGTGKDVVYVRQRTDDLNPT